MPATIEPHEIVWDRETSGRFWDYMSKKTSGYFSEQVGDSLIQLTQKTIGPLQGRILDFGCGPGYLLEKLMARNIACEGADFSPDSLEAVSKKFQGNALLQGVHLLENVPSTLPENTYDATFFIETIEHILPEELPETLAELHRIANPGGYVIVTTPNEENLDNKKVMCPECGSIFHRVQHVSSWNTESLSAVMEQAGFETVCSRSLILKRPGLMWLAVAMGWKIARRRNPHLVYIGRKK